MSLQVLGLTFSCKLATEKKIKENKDALTSIKKFLVKIDILIDEYDFLGFKTITKSRSTS